MHHARTLHPDGPDPARDYPPDTPIGAVAADLGLPAHGWRCVVLPSTGRRRDAADAEDVAAP